MDISSLGHTTYYQNESITNSRDETAQSADLSLVNNLNAIYIDPDAISDLTLKAAHTSEILMQKIKEIHENRPLKDVNFEKESKRFDKTNIVSLSGSLKDSQASFISSKRVSELLT
ncbi:MAG: hypothetical protein HRT43_13940 [Campylobacteraceae bacterium]|nr:hypothetical protein [Campylobacteraceae bacterium]